MTENKRQELKCAFWLVFTALTVVMPDKVILVFAFAAMVILFLPFVLLTAVWWVLSNGGWVVCVVVAGLLILKAFAGE